MRRSYSSTVVLALLAVAPLMAGCSGSDVFSKDAEWFSRPGRLFIKNISIDAPPLSPNQPVTTEDLVSADGACPGMQAAAEANAASPPSPGGSVSLGHTECDVVRGIGGPDHVELSSNPRGDRVAVVTWARGPRAGIYTFTGGRLSAIEGSPEPAPLARPVKKAKKKAT